MSEQGCWTSGVGYIGLHYRAIPCQITEKKPADIFLAFSCQNIKIKGKIRYLEKKMGHFGPKWPLYGHV